MFIEERQIAIEKVLREQGKVRTRELSEMFQVTEDCIRKDLKTLENAGKLKRNYHVDRKMVIAAKAMTLIKEREAIFLDISTTNIELAKLLAKSKMQLTVVSNMIDILQLLAQNPKITAIGTGGIMYPTVNGFLGSAAIQVIRQYSFDRAFMGSCGIDMMDHTVTTLGVEDGLTKKAAIESSRHKYAVMEREKFYFNESYKFTQLDELDGIITDEFPDQSVQDMLDSLGVTLY